MRVGAASEKPRRRRTISSRVVSLKRRATTAEASTTLKVTVFADQPRRLVAALKAERGDFGGDLIDRKLYRNACRSFVDQRPQLSLERPRVGLGAGAE